ncbi:hypothetical protein AMTRI_Chr01g134980 [Amborella trichopoda]|uniref:Uncharacterized protein n=1 Tax=Amborella trichopoda TaxID=13333 RepID=W1PHX1_AMBTC|nr:hypothetical protein AMTR_s00058p00202240 [Amborella trichopoda]
MSVQVPLQPQPVVTYPQAAIAAKASHSKGSFGPVFAVLSVITVLGALACILGRFCARRHSKHKHNRDHTYHVNKDPEAGVKESEPPVKVVEKKEAQQVP